LGEVGVEWLISTFSVVRNLNEDDSLLDVSVEMNVVVGRAFLRSSFNRATTPEEGLWTLPVFV